LLWLTERGFWEEISKNKLPKISLNTGKAKVLGRGMAKYLKISMLEAGINRKRGNNLEGCAFLLNKFFL
jgi:hypothetical protein